MVSHKAKRLKGAKAANTQIRIPEGVEILWTRLLYSVSGHEILSNPARCTRKAEIFVMRLMTADMSN